MDAIIELTSNDQWLEAYPVMKQLRTDLTEKLYMEMLKEMVQEGYKLFALYNEGTIVSLAGLNMRVNFYNRKHVFINDLVTDENARSFGFGERLLRHIHDGPRKMELNL